MKIRNSGFTMIEIMIVVVILGVIAAVAIPSYNNYIERTRIATARTKLQENATKLGRLYLRKNSFAGASAELGVASDAYFEYSVDSASAESYLIKAKTHGDIKKSIYFDHLGVTYICPIDDYGNSSASDSECEKK